MKICFIVLILVIGNFTYAQWKVYPNSPYEGTRFDDVHFHTKDHGTIVDGDGNIITTFNGGENWNVTSFGGNYFRSIGFLNSSVGFVGSLQGNVYKTIDGGLTWNSIRSNFPINKPIICGISCVDGVVFATGNYAEPAEFFKSTDEGASWEYTLLDSLLAAAVEVQFLNSQEGYISGMGVEGKGTIIYTSDGGKSWKIVGVADYSMSYIWKLQILESGKAYGSIQNFRPSEPSFIERVDASAEWVTHTLSFIADPQGIGFLNDEIGWIGGNFHGLLVTNDGGDSWDVVPNISNVNRIMKLDDNTMIAVGRELYIYDNKTTSNVDYSIGKNEVLPHSIVSISPNPTKYFVKLEYELSNRTLLTIDIFDIEGKKILHIIKDELPAGRHENIINTIDLAAGQYFITIRTSERHLVEKFLVVK